MLPGPTNVPERVTRAMVTPSINHRSDDFVELYEECVDNSYLHILRIVQQNHLFCD